MSERSLTYQDAGVDIDAANRAMGGIAEMLRSTRTADTLSDLGSFGGLFRVPGGYRSPVLVASTDGVGTKLKLAFMSDRHDTVGEDLVNHCVNDILVQGAIPLFFLDYIGIGKLRPGVVEAVVSGAARGCRNNDCALLGGETAEMPDFYAPGEYDLAGTIIGIVEEDRILDGGRVREGDAVIALGSDGLHTNGYSLARRIVFDRLGLGVDDQFPEEAGSVTDVLLRVHRSYLQPLRPHLAQPSLHAIAHITGGGILENIPRVLPDGLSARIEQRTWDVPPVFRVLQRGGDVDDREMFRAFNMGIGMAVIVDPTGADGLVESLSSVGERVWIAGEIVRGEREVVLS
jgi:phosphoribosylformylglycinamidine cyclo-ligase